MNAQHTPGPWRIGCAGTQIYGPKTEEPAPVTICGVLAPTPRVSRDERRANARLIAAAPDMLATLQAIATQAELTARTFPNAPGRGDWLTVERRAREAIAAATGETKGGSAQ